MGRSRRAACRPAVTRAGPGSAGVADALADLAGSPPSSRLPHGPASCLSWSGSRPPAGGSLPCQSPGPLPVASPGPGVCLRAEACPCLQGALEWQPPSSWGPSSPAPASSSPWLVSSTSSAPANCPGSAVEGTKVLPRAPQRDPASRAPAPQPLPRPWCRLGPRAGAVLVSSREGTLTAAQDLGIGAVVPWVLLADLVGCQGEGAGVTAGPSLGCLPIAAL